MHGCCFIMCIDFRAAATADEGHLPTEPGKTGVQLSSESTNMYLHIKIFKAALQSTRPLKV